MKLKEQAVDFEINSENQISMGLSEENHGLFFDLLISKIYSFPIGSVCREISCNCRDSHREANVQDKPIEIEILSDSIFSIDETKIIFRDRGVGISPERMNNIFPKLGNSTKRDSNFQTGGFGLGSKTPFAYTNRFQIKTVFDKIEYVYSALATRGVNASGSIVLLFQRPTEELNGTEIIIPIKNEEDVNEFKERCMYWTASWDPMPKFIWSESETEITQPVIEKLAYLDEAEKVFLFKVNRRTHLFNRDSSAIFIFSDGIPYELNLSELGMVTDDLSLLFLNKYISTAGPEEKYFLKIGIDVEVGEVSMMPGREQLHFDEETKEFIREKLHKLFSAGVAQMLKKITSEQIPNELHFHKKMFQLHHCFAIERHSSSSRKLHALTDPSGKLFPEDTDNSLKELILMDVGFAFLKDIARNKLGEKNQSETEKRFIDLLLMPAQISFTDGSYKEIKLKEFLSGGTSTFSNAAKLFNVSFYEVIVKNNPELLKKAEKFIPSGFNSTDSTWFKFVGIRRKSTYSYKRDFTRGDSRNQIGNITFENDTVNFYYKIVNTFGVKTNPFAKFRILAETEHISNFVFGTFPDEEFAEAYRKFGFNMINIDSIKAPKKQKIINLGGKAIEAPEETSVFLINNRLTNFKKFIKFNKEIEAPVGFKGSTGHFAEKKTLADVIKMHEQDQSTQFFVQYFDHFKINKQNEEIERFHETNYDKVQRFLRKNKKFLNSKNQEIDNERKAIRENISLVNNFNTSKIFFDDFFNKENSNMVVIFANSKQRKHIEKFLPQKNINAFSKFEDIFKKCLKDSIRLKESLFLMKLLTDMAETSMDLAFFESYEVFSVPKKLPVYEFTFEVINLKGKLNEKHWRWIKSNHLFLTKRLLKQHILQPNESSATTTELLKNLKVMPSDVKSFSNLTRDILAEIQKTKRHIKKQYFLDAMFHDLAKDFREHMKKKMNKAEHSIHDYSVTYYQKSYPFDIFLAGHTFFLKTSRKSFFEDKTFLIEIDSKKYKQYMRNILKTQNSFVSLEYNKKWECVRKYAQVL